MSGHHLWMITLPHLSQSLSDQLRHLAAAQRTRFEQQARRWSKARRHWGLNEQRNQQVAYELAAASGLDVGAVGVQATFICNLRTS
jgi:predicted YcjX-like family ATPase